MRKMPWVGLARALALSALVWELGVTAAQARFFDACAAPGDQAIHVVQNTVVRNERITFQSDGTFDGCEVTVDDGVTLKLQNVRIDVVADKSLRFDGGAGSRLLVENSRINACDSDVFGFAFVRIANSRLLDPRGQTCDVKEIEPDGDVQVIGSTLATNVGGDTDVVVSSDSGRVLVQRSTLKAGDDIRIELPERVDVSLNGLRAKARITVVGGATRVLGNLLVAEEGPITIVGSPCSTGLNLPRVACGAPPP